MLYLDNTTEQQTIFIPRNDGLGVLHKGSYEEGYEEGFIRGKTFQKSLMISSAFTENGNYTRDNGWYGVNVNVNTASTYNSGYTSGYTDGYESGYTSGSTDGYASGYATGYTSGYSEGFESGYTSGNTDGYSSGYTTGEQHQKSLLSTTAFTENGEFSNTNGWSAVTVSVPTGSTTTLEEKNVSISADTTVVLPSSGFDGMSAVTIDASNYAQSNYDGGFDDGFADGYASGFTNGFESGKSESYVISLDSDLFGGYYPVDSATNKSYCTHFPDLTEGTMLYFDILSNSNRTANHMLGGDYSTQDKHYLMVGFDYSNDRRFELTVKSNGGTGSTNACYMSSIYIPNQQQSSPSQYQRVKGEISVSSTGCTNGLSCVGYYTTSASQGDFTGPYPIKFNQDFASAFTLVKLIYQNIENKTIEHNFSFDPEIGEIKDWITGQIAPTYDYNGNRVSGVLEIQKI